jgi:hypothetical protein
MAGSPFSKRSANPATRLGAAEHSSSERVFLDLWEQAATNLENTTLQEDVARARYSVYLPEIHRIATYQ